MRTLLAAALIGPALTASAAAGEWPHWRGPDQNGISSESGLISAWSKDGQNLIWSAPFTGRSTPVVIDGRVCANGRVGEGIMRQEVVACFDAGAGRKLWEHRFTPYLTTVPWNRVGWANLTADPDTGYIYAQGVGGTFICFDKNGKVVWQKSLVEEYGFFSGYGGRTQTPLIDEDRLIVTFVSASWGDWSAPRHRLFAFDKRSGEHLWTSTPGAFPADMNSQSTPVAAVVDDRRILVQGNGDGWIYAVDARTGEKIWGFHLSKRAINSTVAIADGVVYAGHSEENVDEGQMGRVVAFDIRGSGDITRSNEKWRRSITAGFSSPLVRNGRVYIVDNSANLHCLDAETGQDVWELNIGRVGKGSPTWADGKIFVTEVNGLFHIVEPGQQEARSLDVEELSVPEGRYAEIYGSPAIAYGRIYFTTEGGIYCLGDKSKPFSPSRSSRTAWPSQAAAPSGANAAKLLAVPAEVRLRVGESAEFRVLAFDEKGRALGQRNATWRLDGLEGTIDGQGRLQPQAKTQFGLVTAEADGITASARVRVYADLPLSEDFESVEPGQRPGYMHGALARFQVADLEGNKVLAKGRSPRSIHRHNTFMGPADWSGYTIQGDMLATRTRRRVPDMGLINSGYIMDVMGVHQRIEVRSWSSELRMAKVVPFSWQADVWYTLKMRVDIEGDKAIIRGKVWPRSQQEPQEWTITAEDPLPIRQGSPGLYGYSPTTIYYDNIKVVRNR